MLYNSLKWNFKSKNFYLLLHSLPLIRLFKFLLAKSAAESLQSCPTLCDPVDCSLPGSSVHGICQARVLEWGAIAFSGDHHETGQILRWWKQSSCLCQAGSALFSGAVVSLPRSSWESTWDDWSRIHDWSGTLGAYLLSLECSLFLGLFMDS